MVLEFNNGNAPGDLDSGSDWEVDDEADDDDDNDDGDAQCSCGSWGNNGTGGGNGIDVLAEDCANSSWAFFRRT